MYIELVPVKGGVGTSTIASALASQLSYMGRDTCIVGFTSQELRDQQSIWGTGHYHVFPQSLRPRGGGNGSVTLIAGETEGPLSWVEPFVLDEHEDVIAIRPLNSNYSAFDDDVRDVKRIVITEQSYLGLSNVVEYSKQADCAIVMGKSNPVLTMKDCENVIECKHVFPWSYDDGVLRAVDAGLWAGRIDRHRFRDHMSIIKHLTKGLGINV